MKRIPIAGPSITENEIAYVNDAIKNAWYENANDYHHRFESAFSNYTQSNYAIALPSCTSAIHLSLLSLDIGVGDEVIVPDVTWIATSAPISYVGATPVFADIDSENWCVSVSSLEKCITEKTRAIIVVDLYGGMPDMVGIQNLAKKHNIALIEDAAEAFGSQLNGHFAGTFGATGVFSFHGSKTMTTGEGGMLITDDKAIYDRVRFLMDHGRTPGDTSFQNIEVAFKYKMSSMQAALGLAQVERAEQLVSKKRDIYHWYHSRLENIEGITLNKEIEQGRNSFWMVTAVFDPALGKNKFQLVNELSAHYIDTRPFFSPLSSLQAYQDVTTSQIAKIENVNSYAISEYGINLPSGLNLKEHDVDYISAKLIEIISSS